MSENRYPLSIKVENLGSLLATTLDNHMLSGGELTITGESSEPLLKAPTIVSLSLDEFKILDAPVFTQVLSFASLQQVVTTLKSEGLDIDAFYGDLSLFNKKLSSDLLRAHGGLVGVTIAGTIDMDLRTLDIEGGLVPFSPVGNVIGKIPLINRITGTGDGEGIIMLDYSVSGSIANPKISVNPGSSLTPGALLNLFKIPDTEQQPD